MMLVERSSNDDVHYNVVTGDLEYLRAQLFYERIAREEAEQEAKKWQRRCIDSKLNTLHSQLNISQELHQILETYKTETTTHIQDNKSNLEHDKYVENNHDSHDNANAENALGELITEVYRLVNVVSRQYHIPIENNMNEQRVKENELSKMNDYVTTLQYCIRELEKIALASNKLDNQTRCEGLLFKPEEDTLTLTTSTCDVNKSKIEEQKEKNKSRNETNTQEIVAHIRRNKKLLLKSGIVVAIAHLFCFGVAAAVGKALQSKYYSGH